MKDSVMLLGIRCYSNMIERCLVWQINTCIILLFPFLDKTFRRISVVLLGADVVMLELHLRIHLSVGGISGVDLDVVFLCCFHTHFYSNEDEFDILQSFMAIYSCSKTTV